MDETTYRALEALVADWEQKAAASSGETAAAYRECADAVRSLALAATTRFPDGDVAAGIQHQPASRIDAYNRLGGDTPT